MNRIGIPDIKLRMQSLMSMGSFPQAARKLRNYMRELVMVMRLTPEAEGTCC
jgi:hypothetical protein